MAVERRTFRLLAVAVLLLVGLVPRLAAAETPTERRAHAKFDEGLALSDEGKWSEALDAFRESDALVANASARLNIATTLRALGRYVEAKHMARSILKQATELKLKPKLRPEVEKLLADVSAKVLSLNVDVQPPDAEVEVDGSPLQADPQGDTELDPGRHVFVVRAPGHDTTTVTRELSASDVRIELVAPRTPVVTTEPEDSPIYEQWWLWTSIGGGLAVTAAVIGIVVATRPEDIPGAAPPSSTIGHVIPVAIEF